MSRIQLSRLIDLPESDLQQVLDYASTLSKPEAANHFKNLLGDSAQAIEFISAFNSRRGDPTSSAAWATLTPAPAVQRQAQSPARPSTSSDVEAVPKPQRGPKKKFALHAPAPRQIVNSAPVPGTAYNKKDVDNEYISGRSGVSSPAPRPPSSNPFAFSSAKAPPLKPPPSAADSLVSDLLPVPKPKPKSSSNPTSRSSTPGPPSSSKGDNVTKISITGGMPMHGASTAMADLDAAIRSLEITTNPSLSSKGDTSERRCNCVATRHPLQAAAPNCLNCGKVVCLKEGLGPCTFCNTPLLSSAEVQAMIKGLRAERGRERMAADRQANRKAEVSTMPRPFTRPREGSGQGLDDAAVSAAEAKAREHRDRLLGFQAQNARRTTVRDEASDFDVSMMGSMWATPEDRARELKMQQKLLREMEWIARPDYEKRKQVLSIDLVGGKIVKKMVAVERPPSPEPESSVENENQWDKEKGSGGGALALGNVDVNRVSGGGAFSRNPLLQGVIKPAYDVKENGTELEGRKEKKTRWRRVQDDLADNEGLILDGGILGNPFQGPPGSSRDEPGSG